MHWKEASTIVRARYEARRARDEQMEKERRRTDGLKLKAEVARPIAGCGCPVCRDESRVAEQRGSGDGDE